MANNKGTSILAALGAAALGATLGVLFAPDEGKNTRKKLKEKIDETAEELKGKASELNEEMKEKFEEGKENIEQKIDSFINKSKDAKDELIEVLERKLQDLKKHNNA